MPLSPHQFHIPVMGTGFTIDTPLSVARFGIDSVLSLVDDDLIERMRSSLLTESGKACEQIHRRDPDSRARRITEYLDLLHQSVQEGISDLRKAALKECSEKRRYFELLPESNPVKQLYLQFMSGEEGAVDEERLNAEIRPGAIDVNIMSKLDAEPRGRHADESGPEFSDAVTALRGFAQSQVDSALVISAGINKRLFRYATQFQEFYRDAEGSIRKKLILKVSSFRSALSQGRFLARLGLEVHEYRLESGLNCGGHAFGSAGRILPLLLEEFQERRDELKSQLEPLVRAYYEKMGWSCTGDDVCASHVSVQGGVGTSGEQQRLLKDYGVDRVGWATPFLLVPEVTRMDQTTRDQLAAAGPEDLYLSKASPLGIPFNNLRNSSSETWTKKRQQEQKFGSPCPKGFLVSSKEFGERPLCTAASTYQKQKLQQYGQVENPGIDRETLLRKACICDHLGNGVLVERGLAEAEKAPTAVCPGPNMAWFNREYSLEEMVGHIYGSRQLTPEHRPHMDLAELQINLKECDRLMREQDMKPSDRKQWHENLLAGFQHLDRLKDAKPYPGEQLGSIGAMLQSLTEQFEEMMTELATPEAVCTTG